jgi:phosphate transport system protein
MYELERIGDHAASVAKAVLKPAPEPPLDGYLHLPAMAEQAAVLVHGVLRARVDADAVAAREIAVLDDEIDRMYHATFDEVVELMRADPANVERGTRIVIASHYLERIGDRSTNIAEDIVYLVTGDVEDLYP